MTKRFGSLRALDHVSLRLEPGEFHAILGENGAGKSTLVKCIMGYYRPDEGKILISNQPVTIDNPGTAHEMGIGMVYQHFTLIPNMTVIENLVMSRPQLPFVLDWYAEKKELALFMESMPFQVPLEGTVGMLAAGEKQKLEILKQLYLKSKILILDEPTSVLTPEEGDEILSLLRQMSKEKQLSILMITHRFREVVDFADTVTILRRGKSIGSEKVSALTTHQMAEMMIGSRMVITARERQAIPKRTRKLEIENIRVAGDRETIVVEDLSIAVGAGEIVGIAGVAGNGQKEFLEVLAGQRSLLSGTIKIRGAHYAATRREILQNKFHVLPEEPLQNACVGYMSVCENMAFRFFDRPPHSIAGWLLNTFALKQTAHSLIERYHIQTMSPDTPLRNLSGGNIQRVVLARELSGEVEVLIVANPCLGLDFSATDEIRAQIMKVRNKGSAVLLVSEELDEILELSDRIVVMRNGKLVYQTTADSIDLSVIGHHMAGHS